MGQARLRHHRLEAVRDDVAGRLGRQHRGQRRAIDAHRPGEFRTGRHQQRAAILDITGDVLEIGERQDAAARCSGRRSPDRSRRAFPETVRGSERRSATIPSIGVSSCLSGGRRMVKCTRSTDGSAFEQIAPYPLAGMRLARNQQHAQPVAHAIDIVTTARLFCSVSSEGPGAASSSTTFSPSWVIGTWIVVFLPERHGAGARRPCRRCADSTPAVAALAAAEIVDPHHDRRRFARQWRSARRLTTVSLRSRSPRLPTISACSGAPAPSCRRARHALRRR